MCLHAIAQYLKQQPNVTEKSRNKRRSNRF